MRINQLHAGFFLLAAILFSCDEGAITGGDFTDGGTGQGGSMTRFAINGNFMYVVDSNKIMVFGIQAGQFEKVNEVNVGFGLETIFTRGDYLYLGALDAMYIWSVADRSAPEFVFRYQHIVSCDPVVVQGNRAYVTMRGGTVCNRGANALEIIDITDPYAPVLLANYPMLSPHGLGVDGDRLFICEGESGFKVFDIADELNIQLVAHMEDFHAYDVIPLNGIATVTGDDGIFQLRYDVVGEPQLISTIPVVRQ